ncbi:hypothetical protein PGB34_00165 [Xenophilus arseniciresistens]|uniref:Transmembrane protein n=1 Tax=Xenophilus arseniciresistens TaxID=1283306 RepID=A0AAE3N6B9_9BURK|nr:hypothetical protein [Xenophilus arseniciresistens]MDA7414762.1 hypothetical protein [Xenophilus arseniciresistens]
MSSIASLVASPRFLPRVMALDAASCALTGAAQLGFTDALARLTGLPAGLLTGTGLFLLGYAVVAAWLALRQPVPRILIGLVAMGNLGWAVGCVLLMAAGPFALSALGMAWLLAQAVTVLLLADAQWMGLRATRTPRAVLA